MSTLNAGAIDGNIDTLDGLRGLAILFVLAGHFPSVGNSILSELIWRAPRFLNLAYIGVDMFFCLSGFLIARVLLRNSCKNLSSMKSFYIKRFIRIFPAYYLTVITCYFLIDSNHILSLLLFFSNFTFAVDNSSHPLRHTWSLGVEVQYYLLFPIIFCAVKKLKYLKKVLIASVFLILLSVVVTAMLYNDNLKLLDKYPNFRFITMFTGAYICLNETNIRVLMLKYSRAVLGVVAIFIIAGSLGRFFGGEVGYYVTRYLSSYIVSISLFCYVLTLSRSAKIPYAFFTSRLMSFIACISYGTYLYHQPILYYFGVSHVQVPESIGFSEALFLLAIIFAVSTFSFYMFESPVAKSFNRRYKSAKS